MVIAVAKCGQVERIERQEQAECHIGPVYWEKKEEENEDGEEKKKEEEEEEVEVDVCMWNIQ